MGCRGICIRYKIKKINPKFQAMYHLGHKFCSQCGQFQSWDGNFCPCCGTILRTKPRGFKGRM